MHVFENSVEFENIETNLNQSLKSIEYPKLNLSLGTESGPPTNETRPPGDGNAFIKCILTNLMCPCLKIGLTY